MLRVCRQERPPDVTMPTTKDIKPKPVEATRKPVERIKPVPVRTVNGAGTLPAVRKGRASSCPRCPQRDRGERTTSTCRTVNGTQQHTGSKASCERRRARSTSTAPKPPPPPPPCSKTNPDHRRASSGVRHAAVRDTSTCQRPQRGVRAEARCADQR